MSWYREQIFPPVLEWVMTRPSLSKARTELLANITGDVLEIGFGTGINLEYYPVSVQSLTSVDVNPGVQKLAQKRLARTALPVKFELINGEALPMPDNSYDAVVSTWTLCSIPNVQQALREIRRVLKPSGRFYFVEHGLHPEPQIAKWQHRLTPVQKRLADGCHLDRDILALIAEAGLVVESYRQFEAEGLPRVGAFMSLGVAKKG